MKNHYAEREGKLITFLRTEMEFSSRAVQRFNRAQALWVNGKPARSYQAIQVGDLIHVEIEEEIAPYPAEEGTLDILYEDDFLLLLDKSARITMHPTSARTEGTLANVIAWYYLQTQQNSGIHFLNRLDRDTFGVVLVAKDSLTHAALGKQLQEGGITKIYHATVFGGPIKPNGVIDLPIGRVEENPILRCVREDGQPAKTYFKVLRRDQGISRLELRPETGRTHQLRVHCAYEGYPILGDQQYGSLKSIQFSNQHGFYTQQLLSLSLEFAHPQTKNRMKIQSQYTL